MVDEGPFFPFKVGIALFITGLIFTSIGAIPLDTTITQVTSAANQTGVISQVNPIMINIRHVFTIVGAIMIISPMGLMLLYIFNRRNRYGD